MDVPGRARPEPGCRPLSRRAGLTVCGAVRSAERNHVVSWMKQRCLPGAGQSPGKANLVALAAVGVW